MVSNHITVLQSCFMYSIILSLWAELSVSLAAASVWFHIHNVYCFYTQTGLYITGFSLGWVTSGDVELSHWLQVILSGARGGLRSGEEHQGAPGFPACRSTPRALAKDWWTVRTQSCLPDLN